MQKIRSIGKPSYTARFELRRPKGLPEQAYRQVLRNISELNRREKLAATGYQIGAEQANAAYLERLRSIIGVRNLTKYAALRKRYFRELRASTGELPKSRRGMKELARIRHAQIRKSNTEIKALGIDRAEVRQIQKELWKAKKATREATLEGERVVASKHKKRKNTTAKPPYDGTGSWATRWHWATFSDLNDLFDQGLHEFPGGFPTASFNGNLAYTDLIGVNNAEDYDEFIVTAKAAVFKWFQMPEGAGLNPLSSVRVRAKLATEEKFPVRPTYRGSVSANWGDTDVDVNQRMDMYARIHLVYADPNPVVRNIFNYELSTNSDDHWDNPLGLNFSGEGNWIGPTTFYGYPYGTGNWVLVEAGILYTNHFTASNAKVDSRVQAAANIEELGFTAEISP